MDITSKFLLSKKNFFIAIAIIIITYLYFKNSGYSSNIYKKFLYKIQHLENKPILVLVKHNDTISYYSYLTKSPIFALYDNGLLIYKINDNHYNKNLINYDQYSTYESSLYDYQKILLQKKEKTELINSVEKELNKIYKLSDSYTINHTSDQPLYIFYICSQKKYIIKKITIRGKLNSFNLIDYPQLKPLFKLYKKLINYYHHKSESWLPSKIEINSRNKVLLNLKLIDNKLFYFSKKIKIPKKKLLTNKYACNRNLRFIFPYEFLWLEGDLSLGHFVEDK